VIPKLFGRAVRVTSQQGLDDRLMLGERGPNAIPDAKLKPSIWTQTPVKPRRSLAKKRVVAAPIDDEVKDFILDVICVCIPAGLRVLAGFVRNEEVPLIRIRHASRSETTTHGL